MMNCAKEDIGVSMSMHEGRNHNQPCNESKEHKFRAPSVHKLHPCSMLNQFLSNVFWLRPKIPLPTFSAT